MIKKDIKPEYKISNPAKKESLKVGGFSFVDDQEKHKTGI